MPRLWTGASDLVDDRQMLKKPYFTVSITTSTLPTSVKSNADHFFSYNLTFAYIILKKCFSTWLLPPVGGWSHVSRHTHGDALSGSLCASVAVAAQRSTILWEQGGSCWCGNTARRLPVSGSTRTAESSCRFRRIKLLGMLRRIG